MEKVIRDIDPRSEVDVAVGLRQNREAVAQADIVVSEARPRIERVPAFVGRELRQEIAVVVGLEIVLRSHLLANVRKQRVALEIDEIARRIRIQHRAVGQRVAVERAVGRVQIDGQQRVPAIEDIRDQAARFRRLEFHVVAIQVEALRVLAHADAVRRTVLRLAILGRDLLVAVGVVDRRDEDRHRAAQFARRRDEIAQQHLRRFFSFNLAGMNVRHDEDDRQTGGMRGARIDDARRAGDHQRQRAPLVGGCKDLDADVGIGALNRGDEAHDVFVP